MSIRYLRLYSRFVHLCSYLGLLACWLLCFAVAAHYFELISHPLFIFFIKISVGCALASLALIVLTLRDMWRYGDRGGLKALRAFLYSGFVLVSVSLVFLKFYNSARLNDVSTDLNNPPAFLNGCAAASLNTPTLATELPRRYETSLNNLVAVIAQLAKTNHWVIEQRKNANLMQIEVKCKDLMTGFPSYLTVRIEPEKNTMFVDARCATCGLIHDGGLSNACLSSFMKQLDAELLIDDIN